jgi:hypothetical protein
MISGHSLAYLRNNRNIPSFVKESIVSKLLADNELIMCLQKEAKKELNWKMTLNMYYFTKASEQEQEQMLLAGFPFHMDIPSNG